MSVAKTYFGKLPDGADVYLYTITNGGGASVSLMTLGGGIQSLKVPDKNGVLADVVLGFDEPKYYIDPTLGYQGLLVGRFANRIKNAEFSVDGVAYHTPVNEGTCTLHGGGGFSFSLWDVVETGENSVTFSRFSPDGEEGFPGNFTLTVKYTFTDANVLRLEYCVVSDKKTVANPTNHTYFNLSGRGGTIEDHFIMIDADRFTEVDAAQLPTGELGRVDGTPLDFREPRRIGDRIDEPFRAVIDGVGYDNNFCLNKSGREFSRAAVLSEKESGRKLEVYTDLPGIQLYCGGWLAKDGVAGKQNGKVAFRRGVALETQFYPDSVHFPDVFPFAYVLPNEKFETVTEYRFSAE